MKPVIFFDLDGVVADFVRGVLDLHGRADFPYDQIEWGIEAQLGIEPAAFWEPLGRDFWANLPVYTDGICLFRAVENLVGPDRIGLLTSPCDTPGCTDGKREWVAKHLPDYRKRLLVGAAKELVAGPGKVLIDDHDANCAKFAAAGGQAVTPPRPWNQYKGMCLAGGSFSIPAVFGMAAAAVEVANTRAA